MLLLWNTNRGKKNDQEHFVEKTVNQVGFPYWSKAIKKAAKSRTHGRAASDSAIVVYVPFVRDSQNFVNASMVIHIEPGDTTFSYLCDWQYSQLANNTTVINDTAENFAIFFMALDKNVFGHEKFAIIDSNLFKNGSHRAYYVTLSDPVNAGGKNNILTPVEVCQNGTIYWFESCPYEGYPQCTPTCDHCILCLTPHSYSYCWDEYIDDGSGGGGGSPPGGGDGGGGGNGSTPPECPGGGVAARTENVTDPCTPGWNPDIETTSSDFPDNPCKVVDSLMTTNNFPLYCSTLRDSLNLNYEKAFMFWDPFSANTTFEEANGVPGTLGVDVEPSIPFDGVVHTHYNDSLRLSVFSFDDFFKLYDWFRNGKIKSVKTFTLSVITDSTAYVMMITDSTAFVNFGNKYLNSKENIRIFKSFFYDGNNINENKSVAENEKAFVSALQSTNAGVSVFRGNNTLTQFGRIKVNINNQVRPFPCN